MRVMCSFDGCERARLCRGLCRAHYHQWQRHGELGPVQADMSRVDRIRERTERVGRCLVWTGSVDGGGYGLIWFKGRRYKVHRAAYEEAHGEIPDGHYVNHLCGNRRCVEPAHLTAATPAENAQYRTRAGANRTGFPNVSEYRGRYRAYVTVDGVSNYLGSHDTARAAHERVQEFKRETLALGLFSDWKESIG